MMANDDIERNNTECPRILVVSNNPFSNTSNNGKTLSSFSKSFPASKVAQLYFSPEIPSDEYYSNYFRVTDFDIIKFSKTCGTQIKEISRSVKAEQNRKGQFVDRIKKYELIRIIREALWKSNRWKTGSLDEWLVDFSPEIVLY